LPLAVLQLCDDSPLANNGIKIVAQASSSCLKGRTPDMTEVGVCQDDTAHDIRLPFAFKFLDRNYSGNGSGSIFVSSNSYVTFGGNSTASSNLGPQNPAFPTIFIGGRDNAMRNIFVGPDVLGWRVRYEGWSIPSLVNTHKCSVAFPPTIVWELIFLYNGTLQLCTGFYLKNATGFSAVSDGVSESFFQKFLLSPHTLYTISTSLALCECDDNPQHNQGVKISFEPSQSCMKGRTPDMIDLRSCQRAGSTSILLPFPFSFLGRTYGGQKDDVFVGDSSFVAFGGADSNFYSSFEAELPDLPALFIGTRQNVLKALSVAPDPLGLRVRYEGWSNLGGSLDDPYISQAFSCNLNTSQIANITWELLFLVDGTLQLCTGKDLANLDPVFDSVAIKQRICSNTYKYDDYMCTNFFQNLSAISAVSDGRSASFLHKFNLSTSTLYTISTGVRQCPTACDDNPSVNKGVKVTSQFSSSCLKGQTPDMTVVGRCDNNGAHSIRLPFPVQFLGRSYSGGDVFVGSDSNVIFGSSVTPSNPALSIGRRAGRDGNALRRLLVGPDPLGWRVRYEGWDLFLSQYDTVQCNRPANVVWELLFMFNSTMQLCTGPIMNNLDNALKPRADSGVWDGSAFTFKMNLAESSLYSISTGLLPCSLDISLSSPIASLNGSSLMVRFPANFRISRYDSVTILITLQGAGFSCTPNTSISLLTVPASSRAIGNASIFSSSSSAPLLMVSLRGIANCSVVSFTLTSVTTPALPQNSRKNINFAVFDANQSTIFTSATGTLVSIVPMRTIIDSGQPVLQLMNNAMRSSTTINISFIPNDMIIPAAFAPSVLVITLIGVGWSLSNQARGQILSPLNCAFISATIMADSPNSAVLKVTLAGTFSIQSSSSLHLLLFNVTTASNPQPVSSVRSAILNSAGSIIATGTNGILDSVVASTMGTGSPILTVDPPVASASSVLIHVALTPQLRFQEFILLPASIIITLSGSAFLCGASTIVTFSSPFDATNGTIHMRSVAGKHILTMIVTSGTFLSGYPVLFRFGPCSTPPLSQPRISDLLAAMIDGSGATVAASSIGVLNEISEDIGQINLLLKQNSLAVTFVPRLLVPSNSFLVISLTGIGLVCKDATALQFSLPVSGAFGTASIIGYPFVSVINCSFTTQYFAGTTLAFTVSPVHGGCYSNVSHLKSALLDNRGNVLAATGMLNYSESMTNQPVLTVQQLISTAANGIIIVPAGNYAGSCNCNNTVDEKVPIRHKDVPVEMKGTAGRSIIDCSGTGLRCLIVRNSIIRVVDIIFKGGSSPVFVSASTIATVWAMFDSENQTSTVASNLRFRAASHENVRFQAPVEPERLVNKEGGHHQHRMGSEEETSVATSYLTMSHKRLGRQLLQAFPEHELLPFQASDDESGGCILVLAPAYSVSLSGVELVRCSSIYGGGGFFNVSNFTAKKLTANGNVARQGGGIFVAAPRSTEIEICNFLNNSVVTSSLSRDPSALPPDPAWAAGAGVWLQRLTSIKQCTFEQNLALAAKSVAGNGANALGSGLYASETSSGSVLFDLQFFRSVSLCGGVGCTSAGTVFIAVAGRNTSIQGLNFIECHVTAIRTVLRRLPSYQVAASGACVSVIDASAGLLKVENLHSVACSVRSSDVIFGGCMNFATMNNAFFSNISVIGFSSNSSIIFNPTFPLSPCGMGGLVLFLRLQNTFMTNISFHFAVIQCMGKQSGAVIYAGQAENVTFTTISASNITYTGQGELRGGIFNVDQLGDIMFTNISLHDSHFAGKKMDGPWIMVAGNNNETVSGRLLALRGASVRNVYAHAENIPPVDGYYAISSILWFPLTSRGPFIPAVIVEDSFFQNVTMSCVGYRCTNYGILDIMTEVRETASRIVRSKPSSLLVSNVSFANIQSHCQGIGCSSRSACVVLSVPDATFVNIQLKNITVSSNGEGSFAGGSFLFLFYNNPLKRMYIRDVISEDARISAVGAFSTAIGGVIAAMYGNISINNVRFLRSYVNCSGASCQSIGGSVGFASSLSSSSKREDISFYATISNSELSRALLACSGASCEASGGGIFAASAYRGPFDVSNPWSTILIKSAAILPLSIYVQNCSVTHNAIVSDSNNVTLSGAGISILLADAEITNSSILENSIWSTPRSAFVGGAGVHLSGNNASAFVVSSIIKNNNASAFGLGGAIFAGTGSVFTSENSIFDQNNASKGGGLFIDAASAFISSSTLCNNSASINGGGIFCVSSLLFNTTSVLTLSNVTVFDNFLHNGKPGAVGAGVYIFGDVLLEVRNGTRLSMNGDNQYPTTEAILSISRHAAISSDTVIFCKSGSVLSIAENEAVNQKVKLSLPLDQEQYDSHCNPACLFTPEVTPYIASGGLMASCIPCPRGTYSLTASSDSNEKVGDKCPPCPFGASCYGGSNVSALKSHWGWKVSERKLTDRFVLLQPGYACTEKCTSISPCGGNRAGVLCGACAANFSLAFFTSGCVPSAQCSAWKWVPLILICIFFQFLFSIWIFQFSSESDMIQKQERTHLMSKHALEQISLFSNLSSTEFDTVVSKMELFHFAAGSTILVQGHPPGFMYIIESGVLNVYVRDSFGKESLIDTIVAPNVIGEQSVINGTACGASVRAFIDSDLWRLDRSCLNDVAESDKLAFARAKQAQYAKLDLYQAPVRNRDSTDDLWQPLSVLMWFYQLSGIMLSVSSPLTYLDGAAASYSAVSFFLNSKPSYQAASDVSAPTVSSFNSSDAGPFQFCVSASFSYSHMYSATFLYYVGWALLMALLIQKRTWKLIRSLIIRFYLGLAWVVDAVLKWFHGFSERGTDGFGQTLRNQALQRQNVDIEIRGPAILKWFVTCFSAVASFMMQGTACIRLTDLPGAENELRWIYDGRVACFSDSGELPGLWQVAPAIGVAFVLVAPFMLWRLMLGIQRMEQSSRSKFQQTLLAAYSGPYFSRTRHWMVVMWVDLFFRSAPAPLFSCHSTRFQVL
jgi:hypothetical protein